MKQLTKSDRIRIALRTTFLQGSWNFERMQNGGWCYALLPMITKLYPEKEEQKQALKRHLLFFNTHPYVASPIVGSVLALEEKRANGEDISDDAIQNVKVAMMGPLAGVGDPVFWFSLRPLLAAICAALAISGSILGAILFFAAWNVIRIAFMIFSQEWTYTKGTKEILSDGFLAKVTKAASIVGIFMIGALIERYVAFDFALPALQAGFDAILPGICAVALTLGCFAVLKKGLSPIKTIALVYLLAIILHVLGIL